MPALCGKTAHHQASQTQKKEALSTSFIRYFSTIRYSKFSAARRRLANAIIPQASLGVFPVTPRRIEKHHRFTHPSGCDPNHLHRNYPVNDLRLKPSTKSHRLEHKKNFFHLFFREKTLFSFSNLTNQIIVFKTFTSLSLVPSKNKSNSIDSPNIILTGI